jgi:hypothetical protein
MDRRHARRVAALVVALFASCSLAACTPQEVALFVGIHQATHSDGWLACVRSRESDTAGGYQAVSPGGRYTGAYQYDATTWNSAARATGHPDLADGRAANHTPAEQDAVTLAYARATRGQPWAGDLGACGRP